MIEVIQHGEVFELNLRRAPVNALNLELLEALLEEHRNAIRDGAKAIVISGKEGLFSAGLDVPDLMQKSRNEMTVFWGRFFAMTEMLLSSKVPVIAAITGHAPAGGAVIAIHCDYRIAARGDFRIGLNEVQVGLTVPAAVLRVLTFVVGSRRAQLLAMTGQMLLPEDALACGLVDEIAEPAEVVGRAVEFAVGMLQAPPQAMNNTRHISRQGLLSHANEAVEVRDMTEAWFSDETQQAMQTLLAKLGK